MTPDKLHCCQHCCCEPKSQVSEPSDALWPITIMFVIAAAFMLGMVILVRVKDRLRQKRNQRLVDESNRKHSKRP